MLLDHLPGPYVLTILQQVAQLLLATCCGDVAEARQAAAATVAGWEPRNEVELRLVARIVMFNLQAGESLAQAADPSLRLSQVIRLRSLALSLSRQAEKAERALEKLRIAHPITAPSPVPEPARTPTAQPGFALPQIAPSEFTIIEQARNLATYVQANGLNLADVITQRRPTATT